MLSYETYVVKWQIENLGSVISNLHPTRFDTCGYFQIVCKHISSFFCQHADFTLDRFHMCDCVKCIRKRPSEDGRELWNHRFRFISACWLPWRRQLNKTCYNTLKYFSGAYQGVFLSIFRRYINLSNFSWCIFSF